VQQDENRNVCNGDHACIKVSEVFGEDAPVPAWPLPDAEAPCVCGAALQYHHNSSG
jgi:hypothetical protein